MAFLRRVFRQFGVRSPRGSCLPVACRTARAAFAALLFILATSMTRCRGESAKTSLDIPQEPERLQFPGNDKQGLIGLLGILRERYLQSNLPFENVRVKGRLSHVIANWRPRMQDLTAETMPKPDWKDFTLTVKGGKKRIERAYTQATLKGAEGIVLDRLYDGDSDYKLDGTALVVTRPQNPESQWTQNDAFAFYQCEFVRFAGAWCMLPEYLQNIVGLLKDDQSVTKLFGEFRWSNSKLQCWRDKGGLVAIQLDKNPGGYRQTVWIDPQRGFRLIKERVQSGKRDGGLFIREERDITYREVAPATFFPHSATVFAATLGKGPERDGGAGWVKYDLDVKSVEFGDFEVDPAYFDPNSLPIPVGANVSDRRGDHTVNFVYDKLPISEELLANAARSKPVWRSSSRTWLIIVNFMVCLFLIVLIARRLMGRQWRANGHG